MYFGVDTDLDAFENIDVRFSGTAVMNYSNAYASDPVLNPDHLNRIDTEIVSMNLTGNEAFVDGWSFHMSVNEGLASTSGYIKCVVVQLEVLNYR